MRRHEFMHMLLVVDGGTRARTGGTHIVLCHLDPPVLKPKSHRNAHKSLVIVGESDGRRPGGVIKQEST